VLPCGNDLLGALACRGLGHIDAGEKEAMRRLILDQDDWSEQQRRDIFDYCETDVDALIALLRVMGS
jgi:DNA polymerase I